MLVLNRQISESDILGHATLLFHRPPKTEHACWTMVGDGKSGRGAGGRGLLDAGKFTSIEVYFDVLSPKDLSNLRSATRSEEGVLLCLTIRTTCLHILHVLSPPRREGHAAAIHPRHTLGLRESARAAPQSRPTTVRPCCFRRFRQFRRRCRHVRQQPADKFHGYGSAKILS